MDSDRPFGQPWLDSCYGETILPGSPWHKVREILSRGLAERIQQQLDVELRRQIIFELVGEDFHELYFPTEPYDPSLLEPPNLTHEARIQLEKEGRNWLKLMINKVAVEVGCHRGGVDGVQCQEMTDLLSHIHATFTTGMNRRLYLTEQELNRRNLEARWKRERKTDAASKTRRQQRQLREAELLRQSTGLKGILRNNVDRSSLGSPPGALVGDVPLKGGSATFGGARHQPGVDGPVSWGVMSNSLGRSVIALLKEDPRRFEKVVARLSGRQLPSSLRKYVWMEGLLRQEQELCKDGNVEQVVRERFGLAVKRRVAELAIRKASSSPVSTLINNDVLKVYSSAPGMRLHMNNTPHLVEAAKALNVLYVYSRTYESYLIYWLYPLQLAFRADDGQGEHIYELAMYLHLLSRCCLPSWSQIFSIAERVMSRLDELDPQLHGHLTRIAQIEALVDSNDFLVHLIHQEKAQADALDAPGSRSPCNVSKEILADPVMFIRRWIGEAFVSILDTQATIFVWDQFFLHRWRHLVVIEDLCLALLLLLKSHFMRASNYTDMKWVFLGEPCLLYTVDIQGAWRGVQQGIDDVPSLNRQRLKTPEIVRCASPPPEATPVPIEPVVTDDGDIVEESPEPEPVFTEPVAMATPPVAMATPPLPPTDPLTIPFDLYVNAATNIPDNATIAKITGRLFNLGAEVKVDDILAFPVLDCAARHPRYAFRVAVNEQSVALSRNAVLLLRLYTVDAHSSQLVIVGNCLCEIVSEKGDLKFGGHCRQLYQGMPDPQSTLSEIKQTSLDSYPRIPGCCVYFRLLPHSVDSQPCPGLQTSFFKVDAPDFNDSEKRIVKSYDQDVSYPKTVRDMIRHIQQSLPSAESGDEDLTDWLRECLTKPSDDKDSSPSYLDLSRAVRYRLDVGVNVQILGASGLPEELHFQCIGRINCGSNAVDDAGGGEEIVAATNVYNFDSLQMAPRWKDDETEMHPEFEDRTCLIVRVIGLAAQYKPHPSHNRPGRVTTRRGRPLESLTAPDFKGWAVLPLFVDGCVFSGEHRLSIYKGQPTSDVLGQLTQIPPETVLKNTAVETLGDAAILVRAWDAHFRKDEQLVDMDDGNLGDGNPKGKKVSAFILGSLEEKYRKLGTSSDVYKKECEFYTEVMENACKRFCDA